MREKLRAEERRERKKENGDDCPFLLDTLSEKEQENKFTVYMFLILLSILTHLAGSLVAFDTTTDYYVVPVSAKCILTCYVAEVRSFKVSHFRFFLCVCLCLCLLQSDLFARRNCTVCWFNKLLCVYIYIHIVDNQHLCDVCYHSRIRAKMG